MEYRVLARKWRPQTFENVVGQDHVVKTLKNAIRLGRVAHAYLFSGPRGTGKTSVARVLAKALNCAAGPAEIPCNQCSNCREITEGISLDVNEIDGASNRGIDEVRELRETIKYAPVSSRYRIYIIDEVHMLTKEAFNALLKTLEEPPSHAIFMFATTEIYKVPATILSRCQHFDFRRIPLGKIMDNLRGIAGSEGITISNTGLTWIARAGQGSIRDAQSVFDQMIAFSGMEIADDDVETLLGVGDRKFLYEISAAVLAGDAAGCLRIVDEVYYAGVDIKYFYQMLLDHFMNLVMMKITGGGELLSDLSDHEQEELKKQVSPVTRETLQYLADILMAEEENVRKSTEPRINLEYVLSKMAFAEPLVPMDALIARMEDLEKRLRTPGPKAGQTTSHGTVPGAAPRTAPSPPPDAASGASHAGAAEETAVGGSEGQQWDEFRDFLKKKSRPLWSKLEPGTFLGYADGNLRIGFPRGHVFFETLQEKPDSEKLAKIAREHFHSEVTVTIVPLEGNGARRETAVNNGQGNMMKAAARQRQALTHPRLQKVIDVFGNVKITEVKVNNKSEPGGGK